MAVLFIRYIKGIHGECFVANAMSRQVYTIHMTKHPKHGIEGRENVGKRTDKENT